MILFSPFLKPAQILVKLCDYVQINSVIDGLDVDVQVIHLLTLKKPVVWISVLVSE